MIARCRLATALMSVMMATGATAAIHDDVRKAFQQVKGEISKETQADRATSESVATYQIQEALKKEAIELSETMRRKDNACMESMVADQLAASSENVQGYLVSREKAQAVRRDDPARDARHYLLDRHKRSIERYCSPSDAARGACQATQVAFPGGDTLASTLLTSYGSGEGSAEGYVSGQREAAEEFTERIVGLNFMSRGLTHACNTEQCRAFEETRKRLQSIESSSRVSYNAIIARRTSPSDLQPAVSSGVTINKGLAGSIAQ